MEVLHFYLVVSILAAAIPTLHSLTYDECARGTDQCLDRFTRLVRGSRDFCAEGRRGVQCVRRLNCPSVMYTRMSFRQVLRTLSDVDVVRCDLGNFLEDFPSECVNQAELHQCVAIYTDRVSRDRNVDKEAVCQVMNDYVDCQKSWNGEPCDVTVETLREFTEREKRRMAVTDCEIPGLNRAGLAGPGVSALAVLLTTLVGVLLPWSTGRV